MRRPPRRRVFRSGAESGLGAEALHEAPPYFIRPLPLRERRGPVSLRHYVGAAKRVAAAARAHDPAARAAAAHLDLSWNAAARSR